jgi:hypothetical protein
MSSTAINALVQISSKASVLTSADQKRVATYISCGTEISASDEILLSEITRNPGRTVQEYITLVSPGANKKERVALTTRYNRLLRKTQMGRSLTTSGTVSLTPLSGRPYWFLDIISLLGRPTASLLVPVRSPAAQRPRMAFSRSIPASLKGECREVINSWLNVGGIGTRWRSQDTIMAVQADVKTMLRQVTREHKLNTLLIEQAAAPMIASMVEKTVRQMMAPALTATSATANVAAA